MEVTEEMRRAVFAAECERLGHHYEINNALRSTPFGNPHDPHNIPRIEVCGPDGQHPHIVCTRCRKAWLVIDDPGEDHDDAVRKLRGRLKPGDRFHDGPRKREQPPTV